MLNLGRIESQPRIELGILWLEGRDLTNCTFSTPVSLETPNNSSKIMLLIMRNEKLITLCNLFGIKIFPNCLKKLMSIWIRRSEQHIKI